MCTCNLQPHLSYSTDHISPEIPQILINREPLHHMTFDVELLGDCDAIVAELCQQLGEDWTSLLQGFEAPCVDRQVLSYMKTPPYSACDGDILSSVQQRETETLVRRNAQPNCRPLLFGQLWLGQLWLGQ